jgi:hypothetical protein
MKQISAAFVKAKRSFGPALKDKNNPHFKSKYADLGACLEAVEDALLENGIALLQETFEDGSGVTVETVFLHESGEERRCGKLHVPAAKQDPQGYGSALTYARRYSLMTACGIAPEDDDGNAASKPASNTSKPAARAPVISVAKGSMEALDEKRRSFLFATADYVKERFDANDILAAHDAVYEVTDDLELMALSTLIPSHIRTAIRKHHEAQKVPA